MIRTLPLIVLALLLSACSSTTDTTLVSHTGPAVEFRAVQAQAQDADARASASALIESMSDAQREATVLALDHEAHADWHFIPRQRRGLSLGEMTDGQRIELHKLLQAGLSNAGYLQAMDIVWLESILQDMEDGNPGRDPGKYTLLLFGDPSDADAAWGWRFEGHHLSLNFTYADDGAVTTPMFMGTAPAVVPNGLHAGKRILADEHNLAFEFIAMLTDEQREAMMIGDMLGDVVTGPGREASLREPAGLAFEHLSHNAQKKLLELMLVYALRFDFDQDVELTHIEDAGIHFAWAGSTNPDEPHYYRIYLEGQFVIEYCTRDGGVDHVHGVFHDLTDPLAADLLRRHFEEAH